MVNTRNRQCNGQPSSNNNNNNNAHLEQLLTTQTQLMQVMLQTLNNMQPLYIQKSNFYSKRIFFLEFGPPSPASPVLARSTVQAAASACSANPGLRGLGVIAKSHLYFEFAQPGDDAFSLCHRHAGPTCQVHALPRAG
jgi:hypothetical protein